MTTNTEKYPISFFEALKSNKTPADNAILDDVIAHLSTEVQSGRIDQTEAMRRFNIAMWGDEGKWAPKTATGLTMSDKLARVTGVYEQMKQAFSEREKLMREAEQALKKQEASDSSYLGRYGALNALVAQSIVDGGNVPYLLNSGVGGVSGAAGAVVPGSGVLVSSAMAPLQQYVAMPKSKERLLEKVEAARKRKGHFGASFRHGLSKMPLSAKILHPAVGALLGGYLGHLTTKDPMQTAIGGAIGGLGGAAAAALGYGGASALSETILSRISDETADRVAGPMSTGKAQLLTGLPFGKLIGAGIM
jgi:hypothetical protein